MSFDLAIYHNLDSRFFEFNDGDMLTPQDRLAKVMQLCNLPDSLLVNPMQTLETIFMQCNMDLPTQDWAKAYRTARHRSLSVGDVVCLGEQAYAVANMGFKPCAIRTEQIVNADKQPDYSSKLRDDQGVKPPGEGVWARED